ncbi:MAG: hypothetical protein ACLP5H_16335 [Desulfomonilaceae bacterium]
MLKDKAIVNAEDAVRSIRSGLSDEAIMEKYEISQKGLQSLFGKLVAAGAIEQSDLDRRKGSLHEPSWILSLRNPPRLANVEEEDEEAPAPASKDRSIWEAYRHYFSAIGGALVGGVCVFLGMTFFGESGPAKPRQSPTAAPPVVTADRGEVTAAEQLTRILEGIANDEKSKGHSETLGKASEYEECLNNCARAFQVVEQPDKALLINCRRECIVKYAERVKAIRKRYYENPDED